MATLTSPALITTAAASVTCRRFARRSAAAPTPRRTAAPLRAVATEAPEGEWVSVKSTIEKKIMAGLEPTLLIVNDDSEKHALHKVGWCRLNPGF